MTDVQPSAVAFRGFAHVVLATVAIEATLEYLLLATPVNRGGFPVIMALRGGFAAIGGGAFGGLAYTVGRRWLNRGTRPAMRRIVFAVVGTVVFLTLCVGFFLLMYEGIDPWVPWTVLPIAALVMLLVLYFTPPGARRALSHRARIIGLVVVIAFAFAIPLILPWIVASVLPV